MLQIKMSKHFKDTGVEMQGLRSLHRKKGREKLALKERTQRKQSECSNITSMSAALQCHNLDEGARLTLSVPQIHGTFREVFWLYVSRDGAVWNNHLAYAYLLFDPVIRISTVLVDVAQQDR